MVSEGYRKRERGSFRQTPKLFGLKYYWYILLNFYLFRPLRLIFYSDELTNNRKRAYLNTLLLMNKSLKHLAYEPPYQVMISET